MFWRLSHHVTFWGLAQIPESMLSGEIFFYSLIKDCRKLQKNVWNQNFNRCKASAIKAETIIVNADYKVSGETKKIGREIIQTENWTFKTWFEF